jgi:hypothetical protein
MAQTGHDPEKNDIKELDPVGIEANNAAPQNEAVTSPTQSSSDSIYNVDMADDHYDIEKHPEKIKPTARPALSRHQTNATGVTEISQTTTQATEAPKRSLWKRINPLKRNPPPVPEKRGQSHEYTAGFFGLLTFQWITPLMRVCGCIHIRYRHPG